MAVRVIWRPINSCDSWRNRGKRRQRPIRLRGITVEQAIRGAETCKCMSTGRVRPAGKRRKPDEFGDSEDRPPVAAVPPGPVVCAEAFAAGRVPKPGRPRSGNCPARLGPARPGPGRRRERDGKDGLDVDK